MMKKLSLKSNAFDKGEVLTRSQLKKVMGGDGSSGGICVITNVNPNQVTTVTTLSYSGGWFGWWDCNDISAHAGFRASEIQMQNGGHTSYDCDCDGVG